MRPKFYGPQASVLTIFCSISLFCTLFRSANSRQLNVGLQARQHKLLTETVLQQSDMWYWQHYSSLDHQAESSALTSCGISHLDGFPLKCAWWWAWPSVMPTHLDMALLLMRYLSEQHNSVRPNLTWLNWYSYYNQSAHICQWHFVNSPILCQ